MKIAAITILLALLALAMASTVSAFAKKDVDTSLSSIEAKTAKILRAVDQTASLNTEDMKHQAYIQRLGLDDVVASHMTAADKEELAHHDRSLLSTSSQANANGIFDTISNVAGAISTDVSGLGLGNFGNTVSKIAGTVGTVAGDIGGIVNIIKGNGAPAPAPRPVNPTLPPLPAPTPIPDPPGGFTPVLDKKIEQTLKGLDRSWKIIHHLQTELNVPVPIANPNKTIEGIYNSSGSNYYAQAIDTFKDPRLVSTRPWSNLLTQSDSQCVICQYLVQQSIVSVTGQSLTQGGATAGGKRLFKSFASKGPRLPAKDPSASFVETESTLSRDLIPTQYHELFAFLEMESGASFDDAMATQLVAELESTDDLADEVSKFFEESSSFLETESEAEAPSEDASFVEVEAESQVSRRRRRLNEMAPTTIPRQLNDWGYERSYRYRHADRLLTRATFYRALKRMDTDKYAKVHAVYKQLHSKVFQSLEQVCSRRTPLAYTEFCNKVIKEYRLVAQGIYHGDRPDAICVNVNLCDQTSYVRKLSHAYYSREAGDN